MLVKRGDIFYVDLGEVIGSEQGGIRPVLVVQNDIGNKFSSTVQVAPMTSKFKGTQKTHFYIHKEGSGLKCDSVAMMEQIRTIDKCRLQSPIGHVNLDAYNRSMNEAIMISFGIPLMQAARQE